MRTATLKNMMNGVEVRVHATTDHSASSYGIPVWVDDDNNAYCQVDTFTPFYEIIEDKETMTEEDYLDTIQAECRDCSSEPICHTTPDHCKTKKED